MIPEFVRRLASDAGLRRQVLGSLEYLFVDEFQDLNESQFALVDILAETARVVAIGDPDQAIYGFRGSDPAFFFRFAGRPGVKQVSLTRNYRCPAAVIEAATALLVPGGRPGRPPLVAESGLQGAIELYRAPTPAAEAEFIVRRIEELMGGIGHFSLASGRGGDGETGHGLGFGDMAVLFRIGRQAQEIASALGRRGIPCQQVGVTPFYLRPEVRKVHDFIQAASGSEVMADWLRLAGSLPGMGNATLERMEAVLPQTGNFREACRGLLPRLPQTAGQAWEKMERSLTFFQEDASRRGLTPALADILPGLGVGQETNGVRRLLDLAGSFGNDLAAFADHLRRYAETSFYDERAEAVALMTLHSAKGLEFPVVFLSGAEEGLLPCTLWGNSDLEEERRLFYVGLTRARERVVLSASRTRPWVGPSPRPLSRFIGDIPSGLVTAAHSPCPERQRQGKVPSNWPCFKIAYTWPRMSAISME